MWQLQLIIPPDVRAALKASGHIFPPKFVKSMRTTDRALARLRSGPMIEEFMQTVSGVRAANDKDYTQRLADDLSAVEKPVYKMEPGRYPNDDGTVTIANEKMIMKLDRDGMPILGSEEINRPIGFRQSLIVPDAFGGKPFRFTYERTILGNYDAQGGTIKRIKDADPARDIDMEILDNWIADGHVDPRVAKEAKDTLAFWRKHTNGLTFSNADWDDGRALADLLGEKLGNKSATVRKKIAFLRRAFVVAKRSPKRFPTLVGRENPFSCVVRNVDDALDKVMFDDADTVLIKSRMHELGYNERVLLTWCLATGCRRSEPFCLRGETMIDGLRTIRFEDEVKNPPSDRTIPLPPILLELHPEPISGPLFSDTEKNIGRNINRWLRRIGITDERKTLHCTRHRAAYRLRCVDGINDSIRHECLGHEDRRDPSETYGEYPQRPLYDAIKNVW